MTGAGIDDGGQGRRGIGGGDVVISDSESSATNPLVRRARLNPHPTSGEDSHFED